MLVLGSLKERSKELFIRALGGGLTPALCWKPARVRGLCRHKKANAKGLRMVGQRPYTGIELSLLAGLVCVIQHDFFALPANPAGEGTWANIFLVQKDFTVFRHQGQGMGLFDPSCPLIGLDKAGLHLFPANRAVHSAQPSVAALTMVAKSWGFREAPPMRPPSTSG